MTMVAKVPDSGKRAMAMDRQMPVAVACNLERRQFAHRKKFTQLCRVDEDQFASVPR